MTVAHNQLLSKKVRSIAIIGGGASGAITLDSLIKESAFDKVTLFERREVPGGVWVLDKKPDELIIPPGLNQNNLDPVLKGPQQLRGTYLKKRPHQQRYIHTASYEGLRTNIPEQLMTFSDNKSWGENQGERVDGKYVHGVAIQRYIERYIDRHKENVVFRTTVESVTKDYSKDNSPFILTLRTETDLKDEDGDLLDNWWTEEFDSVVVATGHYHVPFIPNVPGLDAVCREFPNLVKHSKTFRDAETEVKDKEVLVIGTRSSGADIVELGSKFAKRIYHSQRGVKLLRKTKSEVVQVKPLITSYELTEDKEVIVYLSDGSTIKNPDLIYYATGFRYSYPFLRETYGEHLTTGNVVPDLYLHTFFTKDPQLSFVGVPCDAISFRAFEFQAVLVARFLSGKSQLPSLKDQISWCVERFRTKGDTRAFHTIDWEQKFEYLDLLVEIGGGYKKIGSHGREFPKFSEDDKNLHRSLQDRLLAFYSVEEHEISGVTAIH
uniref:Flavin-containing monooxygenase n=1 Tax=Cyberlindnera americana TaxID=36016 RepID=A0A5P8N8W3_9ASCO|nr:flavin-containing monooxygenase [Cyberlindnera americana]